MNVLKEEHFVARLVELLNMLKICNGNKEKGKNVRQQSQGNQLEDHDPQFNLEIIGYMVRQVMVDFDWQVNILPRETWINMARPNLHRTTNYLKLDNYRFIEPIGMLGHVQTSIMGISMIVDFEVIDLVDRITAYPALVG